ncbi:cytochrome c3 family protein [Roseateles sp.]|uniref:cytochrome c3 family protein n=1 Tax=Roseateles sp. TaxID=1971397 RepID=UPI002DF87473|nr:cytochrome c3 family protein [Roseateles sp.]
MDPVFRRRAELGVKLAFLTLAMTVLTMLALLIWRARSYEPIGETVAQPIPFSHKHHVGDDGVDCRYCHTTVEKSAFAGMPSSAICLSCHSQLYTDQALLAPLHESSKKGLPIAWRRVHQLPDFVYFNHSAHVNHGVACVECHGRLDQMPLTWRSAPLQMQWCLACHANPTPHLRPPQKVFEMPPDALENSDVQAVARLLQRLPDQRRMTDCSTCHR